MTPFDKNSDKDSAGTVPLVCDLDGTLTRSDTLAEACLCLVRRRPLRAMSMPLWLASGRAHFKRQVVAHSGYDAQHVPLREDLLEYLQTQRLSGRRIVLATAADQRVADAVAMRAGIFDAVYASDGERNLKGREKLALIREREGDRFAYAGDSRADLPIWREASAAILVDVDPKVARQVRDRVPVEHELQATGAGGRAWARALRVHQWLKNALIFVPLLTSFSFLDSVKVLAALMAFLAFSLVASATYVANDLWDLESDRQHPRKRHRPLASGELPILQAVAIALGLLVVGVVLAATVSLPFLGTLLAYLVATSAYSWTLKRYVLVDVVVLALLYTLRVLAGAVAIDVRVTPWLLAFSLFVFLSLALLKRCAELVSFGQEGRLAATGRDYRVSDLAVLWPMGVGAGLCAVVVFGLFVTNAADTGVYARADLLWAVGIGLIYWLGRLWIKTARGEMHDDPIVFTLRDRGTRLVLLAMVVATVVAHFL